MSAASIGARRFDVLAGEIRKLPAFLRRDFLVAWSYKLAFVSGWVNLLVQTFLFYFVSRLVDTSKLPTFAGRRPGYMEFVIVGIVVSSFLQIGLSRVVTAIRNEQLIGTLESLLMTPTSPATLQLGLVFYDLFYVPLRTFLFLGGASLLFELDMHFNELVPAVAVLLAFIPIVWGLGVTSTAAMLTFRHGLGLVGIGGTLITLLSGAYFPIGLLPDWAVRISAFNPMKITLDAAREVLLGRGGWDEVLPALAVLIPMGLVALFVGVAAFRLALARERRRGTLGMY